MKVGVITLMAALLLALPALAGTVPDCEGHDSDADGVLETCDNCDVVYNNTQTDDDSDGHGDMCDADYNQSNFVDGQDFIIFGQNWGLFVPPGRADVDHNDSGFIDGQDFIIFGNNWGTAPGTSCGNAAGVPCPHVP